MLTLDGALIVFDEPKQRYSSHPGFSGFAHNVLGDEYMACQGWHAKRENTDFAFDRLKMGQEALFLNQ